LAEELENDVGEAKGKDASEEDKEGNEEDGV